MSKYQITLTPIDKFFFGGDMTFMVGNKEDDEFNEKFSSYIIRSSLFPQQTSLLGMLRFFVLRNAGEKVFKDGKIADKGKASEIIGKRSFSVNDNHAENDFGQIKSITHVRIRKSMGGNTSDLEIMPLYSQKVTFKDNSVGVYNFQKTSIPEMDGYNAKDGLRTMLTDGDELMDKFTEDLRVGINRNIKDGKTEDKALFKQISYRFNNKDGAHYCFVFEAEVDDSMLLDKYSGQIVSIGGDNSQFVIGISKDTQNHSEVPSIKDAVYLLSPTYLRREEAQNAIFAITELRPFRFLESEMDKVNSYHILKRQLNRSRKYMLYAPGSIFYFENTSQKEEFIKAIESKQEFRQIGYNEYK